MALERHLEERHRALAGRDEARPVLRLVARVLGREAARHAVGLAAGVRRLAHGLVRLELEIDEINDNLSALNSFILPGGTPLAAWLHLARTVARRAERQMTELATVEPVNEHAMQYINRLSDLLFVLARHANDGGKSDILWVPGGTQEADKG